MATCGEGSLLAQNLCMALKFSGAHVWVRVEGAEAVLGISDYLQDQMGEITAIELPDLGDLLHASRRMGHVESEEASSPLEAPISGEVVEVNGEAIESSDLFQGDLLAFGPFELRVNMEPPRQSGCLESPPLSTGNWLLSGEFAEA